MDSVASKHDSFDSDDDDDVRERERERARAKDRQTDRQRLKETQAEREEEQERDWVASPSKHDSFDSGDDDDVIAVPCFCPPCVSLPLPAPRPCITSTRAPHCPC